MNGADAEEVQIPLGQAAQVSALWQLPPGARACFVLAHGAGAGMRHPFIAAVAAELATLGIASLRYQFPYMQRGAKRPDPPDLCYATVNAAVRVAAALAPALPLFAGGKSFGGRMTSQAQATAPLAQVRGLIFLGFPLHPPERPADARGQHLRSVQIPMLFLQGTRDQFADLTLLQPLIERLGERATLIPLEQADHSFHVRARASSTDAEIRRELVQQLANWIASRT